MPDVLISGDWHGNVTAVKYAAKYAYQCNIEHIFQVGDFGYFPGMRGVQWLDDCQKIAQERGVTIFALPGNHDWHDEWIQLFRRESTVTHWETGGAHVRSNVVLLPRTATFSWFDQTWGIVGGAVSIDRYARTEGLDWWEKEEIGDWEVDNMDSKVDILLTHDASNKTPWGFELVPDLRSMYHRDKIDRLVRQTLPEVHFHGHFHRRYDWVNEIEGHRTQTYGLSCNGWADSNGILNTETLDFEFLE